MTNIKRRIFLKAALIVGVMMAFFPWLNSKRKRTMTENAAADDPVVPGDPFSGVDEDGLSRVYMAGNASPEENMIKTLALMGGIEKIIGPRDIVVLKPNAQWWNQGMTNTDAMKAFIEEVLFIPGFSGEIIVAENHQYEGADSRGWTTDKRNGAFNLNEIVSYFQNIGHTNVSKYHWKVAGTAELILQGDAQGDRRTTGPANGDGYVWEANNYYLSPSGRKCLMTYPVFTSAYSGITIDLKNGPWYDGNYLNDRRIRFINFSALNHHGRYCGVTASVKNLMGVVDMTCGFPGDEPEGAYNTHHIGVDEKIAWTKRRFIWRLGRYHQFMDYCYRNFHHTGGALGYFMRHVRMPDLHIITAERVGWGSRTDLEKSFQPRFVLASRDPVALDYIAARDILFQGTPANALRPEKDLTYRELNNPEKKDGPFYRFLKEAHKQKIGNLDKEKIKVVFHSRGSQYPAETM